MHRNATNIFLGFLFTTTIHHIQNQNHGTFLELNFNKMLRTNYIKNVNQSNDRFENHKRALKKLSIKLKTAHVVTHLLLYFRQSNVDHPRPKFQLVEIFLYPRLWVRKSIRHSVCCCTSVWSCYIWNLNRAKNANKS